MKTFVILSDSHGRWRTVEKLVPLFAENDMVVHLGDGAADMRGLIPDRDKYKQLQGNCDLTYAADELVIDAGTMSVFCCHGHRYGVKSGLKTLAARARELGCKVALYGHTHIAKIEEIDGVLTVNPGAVSDYVRPTYAYLVINGDKAVATIVPIQ